MKKLHAQEEKIKRSIRDAIAVDPLISIDRLREALFDKGLKTPNNTPLDWEYVARLRKKVHQGAIENADRQLVQERIVEFKEKNRLVFDRLMRIAYYTDDMKKDGLPPPSCREQIAALTAMVRLDILVFNAELDAGRFQKHIGRLEVEKRYIPLPQELKEQMMQAFKNWGVIPQQIESKIDGDNTPKTTTAIVVAKQ